MRPNEYCEACRARDYPNRVYSRGQPPAAVHGRPLGGSLVNGFTDDLVTREVIFEYDNGARNKENNLVLPAMPDLIKQQPMSLWNFCLELHVGRCYSPFLGVFYIRYIPK